MKGIMVGAGLLCAAAGWAQEPDWTAVSGENCTFRSNQDEYLSQAARERKAIADRVGKFGSMRMAGGVARSVRPDSIPRRNFVDVEILDRLEAAGMNAAPLTTDEEFLRRVTLDLTGRIPSAADVRAFAADSSPGKRDAAIERLLYSREFVDKWSMWMGDLLGNVVTTNFITRAFEGRNRLNDYIRGTLGSDKSLRDMVYELITASGNSFDPETAAVNYIVGGRQTMGPSQDVYDYMLYQAAEKFLGLSHYDCLLCHDGRRHLDDLSLWGKSLTRLDAERMAAFFSRTTWAQNGDRLSPLFQSWTVTDRTTGNYALGTTFGNRPNRVIVGNVRAVDAEYRDGSKPGSAHWRGEFAAKLTGDPLFALNFANRIWKEMFNYGLVEPVNQLDPARLDPDEPPPAGWSLQASHPRLLKLLAAEFVNRNYNLKEFIRLLAESSAYQLSARYDGEWNLSQVPLFARRYPRRLTGEEVHDAIVKATGVAARYTVQGFAEPVEWACQLPDPQEPRSNGAALNFMNAFLRGNRDTMTRSQSGSILQQLNLMNDAFVTSRNKVTASPVLQAISRMTSNDSAVEEMYLTFLSRKPSDYERREAAAHLARGTTTALRNAYLEDLAWVLMNKVEFIFSY